VAHNLFGKPASTFPDHALARDDVNKASTLAPIVPAGGKVCATFIGQNSHHCIDNNAYRRRATTAAATAQ
jgi:hypothetical protein